MTIELNSVRESADTVFAEVRTHAPGAPGKLDTTPDMMLKHAFCPALRRYS